MKRPIPTACLASLIALIALPSVHSESLSLTEARTLALERSAAVRTASLEATEADLAITEAKSSFLPSVSAGASLGTTLSGMDLSDPSFSLSASQSLYSGGSTLLSLKDALLSSRQMTEALRTARLEAITEVDTLYLAALKAAESRGAAAKDLEAAERSLELATAQKKSGSLSELDYLEAQSSWASKKTSLTEAKYAELTARRKLSSCLGREVEPQSLDESLWAPLIARFREAATADLDGLVQKLYTRAIAANPSITSENLAVERSLVAEKQKLAAFLPTASASLSLGTSLSSATPIGDSATISLSASIPLFPVSGKLAALKSARLSTESSRIAAASGLDDLSLSLYTSLLGLLSSTDLIESARMALSYAEQNHKMLLEKVRLSSANYSELADAVATLTTARYQYIAATFDQYTALTSLARLLALEGEETLTDALQ